MSLFDALGKWLIVVGLAIAALGLVLFLAPRIPFLHQLGRLPGDIHYHSPDGRVSCWIPIVSSILLSILLTLGLNLAIRLLHR